MLNSRFGLLKYYLYRNDWIWKRLSGEEKEIIFKANIDHNVNRDDYKNPEEYGVGRSQTGENWDSEVDRASQNKGKAIRNVLDENKPSAVLEIGPGPGFYTRMICEEKDVREYVAVDIGKAFLDYLEPRLQKIKSNRQTFSYELVCEDFMQLDYENRFDCIVLFSTVHHIPNRLELFKKLSSFLKEDGVILCIDPSHYLYRIFDLIRKSIFRGLLKKSYWMERTNLSTHHMCTYGEYKNICSNLNLEIEKEWYFFPKKIMMVRHSLLRFLSREMGILLKKRT